MVKKLTFFLLTIPLSLDSFEDNCHKSYFSQHVLAHIAMVHTQRQQNVMSTFKDFLKKGTIPNESIHELIKQYHDAFHDSECEHTKATGEILKKVQEGQATSINGLTAVACFEKTIKTHDPSFELSWWEKTCAAANGLKWFLTKR